MPVTHAVMVIWLAEYRKVNPMLRVQWWLLSLLGSGQVQLM
jgi:lipid-A-disaccharide synthase-like uncharacterized protein